MTPMVNLVFLLIIFFLMSSLLTKRETSLPLDLPAVFTHQKNEFVSNPMTINIHHDGRIQVGADVATLDRTASMLMKQLHQQDGNKSVRIRTDQLVPFGVVEPLLRDLSALGITDITFAVRQDK